jgi:hypothetical protein
MGISWDFTKQILGTVPKQNAMAMILKKETLHS